MKDFYITFMDCDNTNMVYTIELAMMDTATVEDARKYFLSNACNGRKMEGTGTEIRALILSVYAVGYIEQMMKEGMELPLEIQRFLGDYGFDKSEPEGESYGPGDADPNTWLLGIDENDYHPPQNQMPDEGGEDDCDDDEGEEWKKLIT
jgi:hypothetical protein